MKLMSESVPKIKYRANLYFRDNCDVDSFICPIIETYTLDDAVQEAFGMLSGGVAVVGIRQQNGTYKTQVIAISPESISSVELVEVDDDLSIVWGENPPDSEIVRKHLNGTLI